MDLDDMLGLSEAAKQYMAAANEAPRLAREFEASSCELQRKMQELTAPSLELQRRMQELFEPSGELGRRLQELLEPTREFERLMQQLTAGPSLELQRLAQETVGSLMDTVMRGLYGHAAGRPSAPRREALRPAAISTPAPAPMQRPRGRPLGTTKLDPEKTAKEWEEQRAVKTQKGFAKDKGINERTVRRYTRGK